MGLAVSAVRTVPGQLERLARERAADQTALVLAATVLVE
jgi:hypothetical protein